MEALVRTRIWIKNRKVRVLILHAIMLCKNSGLATRDYEKRSVRPEWREKYGWLHYDVDVAFCYIRMYEGLAGEV